MFHSEYQYLDLLQNILDYGEQVKNRTGTDSIRLLGVMHRWDFKDGFPLLTTKQVFWKGVVHELLWFLSGSTNIKYLVDNGVNIWNDDAYRYFKNQWLARFEERSLPDKETFIEMVKLRDYGDLGPVYGQQWRNWFGEMYPDGDHDEIDQVKNLVTSLKEDPTSRRHILSAWNVVQLDQMALPPCHTHSQYSVTNEGKLWCHFYQRSCDVPLGAPFNIASYALLTHMLAQVTGLQPGGVIHTIHDAHIYINQIDGVREQLKREPYPFPQLHLNKEITDIDLFKPEDITLVNYLHHDKIRMPLST